MKKLRRVVSRWIHRKERIQAREAASIMDRAWVYLWEDFASWASTWDREGLTAPQWDALHIVNRGYREALCRHLEVSL